jgi:hypothetical protein
MTTITQIFLQCFPFFSCKSKKSNKVSNDELDIKNHVPIKINTYNPPNNLRENEWDIENNCGERPQSIPVAYPILYNTKTTTTTTIITHRNHTPEKYYSQSNSNTYFENRRNKTNNKQSFYLHNTSKFLYSDNNKYVNEDIENGYGFFILLD